jgi:hypothetical protein
VPYLQFDLPAVYPVDRKRRRVRRLYATLMQTTPRIVKVAFREPGAGNLPPEAKRTPGRVWAFWWPAHRVCETRLLDAVAKRVGHGGHDQSSPRQLRPHSQRPW